VVDGWFLPDQPTTLFKEGKQHNVPVILGSNKDDGTVFSELAGLNKLTAAEYESLVRSNAGDSAAEVLAMFPAETDAQVPTALSNLMTQMDFASFPNYVAGSVSKKTKAFLYQFTRVPPTQTGTQLGAYHGAELPYVFGNLDTSQGYGQTDLDLSKQIMGYWTRFAKTGTPNGSGAIEWPAYGPGDRNLTLGDQITIISGLYKAQIDLAEKIYAGGNP
jgi:para-nitrobenzyl esterase